MLPDDEVRAVIGLSGLGLFMTGTITAPFPTPYKLIILGTLFLAIALS